MRSNLVELGNVYSIFKVYGCNSSEINDLRRTISNSVPVMAIDNVEIVNNSSSIPDEYLMHRICMVPINTPICYFGYEDSELPDDRKYLEFSINVSGTSKGFLVDSKCLKWNPLGTQKDDIYVDIGDICCIAKLDCNQNIELVCKAVKGTGSIHCKWNPVVKCYYILNSDNSYNVHVEVNEPYNPQDIFNYAFQKLKSTQN